MQVVSTKELTHCTPPSPLFVFFTEFQSFYCPPLWKCPPLPSCYNPPSQDCLASLPAWPLPTSPLPPPWSQYIQHSSPMGPGTLQGYLLVLSTTSLGSSRHQRSNVAQIRFDTSPEATPSHCFVVRERERERERESP